MRAPPADVRAYLEALPGPQRAALLRLRAQILGAAPKATERISYNIPAFEHEGMLVWMAAFKKHLSFFPKGSGIEMARELGYGDLVAARGTIRFTVDEPLPATLVRKIVKARVKENEAAARLTKRSPKKSRGKKSPSKVHT